MDLRGVLFQTLIPLVLVYDWCCLAEKLSPDQKAPPFARGSGGLILTAPLEGEAARGAPSTNTVDGVEREETEMLKLVDGELVRTVEGHFSYKSPEGLPIFVKYVADENGNRASFKFGSGQTGGVRVQADKDTRNGQTNGRNDGTKSSTYLPPKNVDRTYLPPSK